MWVRIYEQVQAMVKEIKRWMDVQFKSDWFLILNSKDAWNTAKVGVKHQPINRLTF
jgi:hypothetical protein